MSRSALKKKSGPVLKGEGAEDNTHLQARSNVANTEWVSTISYWNDYLTIMDLQAPSDLSASQVS
jgi:hypothetical protein